MKITNYLFPIKSTIFTITMAGMLLALRLIIGLVSIKAGPVVLSIAWSSLFVAGFILGPIIGYMFGWISDSIGFLIRPGSAGYMWEYSIQESLIVLLGALIGILYKVLKDNKKKWIIFASFEIILTGVIGFGVYMVSKYFDFSHVAKAGGNVSWIDSPWIKITGLIMILSAYVGINIITVLMIRKGKDANLLMAVVLTVVLTWVLFAWIMGPWANSRWYERITGHVSASYKIYGYKFYSLASILKSLFMIPIEIALVYPIWKAYSVWSQRSEIVK